jgi:hypothetical protein
MDRGQRQFRTNFPPRGMLVHGSLLNQMGGVLNASVPPICASDQTGHFSNAFVGSKPMLVGVAEITDAADTGGIVNGERQAPHGTSGRYKIKVRVFDGATGTWLPLDTEQRLDANIYHDSAKTTGAIPVFKVGEEVPVVYDPVSTWFYPLIGPMPTENETVFYCEEKVGVIPPELARGSASSLSGYNAAQFALEVSAPGGWLASQLMLVPINDYVNAGATGTFTVYAPLKQYTLLRLKGGVHPSSRASITVSEYKLSVRWLGRIKTGMASGALAVNPQGVVGYTTLGNWTQLATTYGRTRDVPTIGIFDANHLRVQMSAADDEWLAAITVQVKCFRQNQTSFIQVLNPNVQSIDEGILVEPNANGFHAGVIVRDASGALYNDRDMSVYLAFIDHSPSGVVNVVAENRMLYGPATFVGLHTDGIPIYAMNIVKEEYEAISLEQTGTVAKGADEIFLLCNGDGSTSAIRRTANLRWNGYTRGKKVLLWRLNGVLVANQIECGTE